MNRTLIALFAPLFVFHIAVYGQPNSSPLNAKQLVKAESLINQLEHFDTPATGTTNLQQHKAGSLRILAAISRETGRLPEGHIKTDIATAVYWYDQATVSLNRFAASQSAALHCSNERPGVYQKLCESISGSHRDLLWAKARLHVSWAQAFIAFQKARPGDLPRLDEVAMERKNDQLLAARVIDLLKVLESEVVIYDSLGAFEADGKLARVPFAVFKRDLQKVGGEAEKILAWLPQNTLKTEISNALRSYQDGAFWWRKIYMGRVVNVSEQFAPEINSTPAQTNYFATTPYTIAINWRHGSKYIKRAEKIIGSTASNEQALERSDSNSFSTAKRLGQNSRIPSTEMRLFKSSRMH